MVKKLCGRVVKVYWSTVSIFTKKIFDSGMSDKYRYYSEVFFDNKVLYNLYKKKNKSEKEYWMEQRQFKLSDTCPERYMKRANMLMNDFIPLLVDSAILLDVGCGEGEWDSKIAPYCKYIDAFDYSRGMIDTAREKNSNLKNIFFEQGDVKELSIKKEYDGALMLGLLMYFDDVEDINLVISNISKHLRKGGYLYSCDTVNAEKKDAIYMLNKRSGYTATYYSEDVLNEAFRNAGLEVIKIEVFDDLTTRRMHFKGIGSIWRKM